MGENSEFELYAIALYLGIVQKYMDKQDRKKVKDIL